MALRVTWPEFPPERTTVPVVLADGTVEWAAVLSVEHVDGQVVVELDAPDDARAPQLRPHQTSPEGLHWDAGMWVQSTG